jgi:hypothetical protein
MWLTGSSELVSVERREEPLFCCLGGAPERRTRSPFKVCVVRTELMS